MKRSHELASGRAAMGGLNSLHSSMANEESRHAPQGEARKRRQPATILQDHEAMTPSRRNPDKEARKKRRTPGDSTALYSHPARKY